MININFITFIEQLTPPVHRRIEVISFIKAAFAPLTQLKSFFFSFFNTVECNLTWNGQVCMLEHLLNNEFDEVDRTIYITDAQNISSSFLFNDAENNEDSHIFNESEGADPYYVYNATEVSQYHFVVNIPAAVTYNEDQLKFYVNKYKLAGKRWKIVIV